jgi:hypothetical protein
MPLSNEDDAKRAVLLAELQTIKEQLQKVRSTVEAIQLEDAGKTIFAKEIKQKIDEILSRLE